MRQSRRDVLQSLALGTLGLGVVPSVAAASEPSATPASLARAGGSQALDELRQSAATAAVEFDIAWPARITAKFRAVFDVPEMEAGMGVWRSGLWVAHYTDVMKAPKAEIQPVIVIRHAAIPFVMNQEFWATYEVGRDRKVEHPITEKRTQRNPVLMTAENDGLPPFLANLTLDKQMANGAIVLACNMAFGQLVGQVGKRDKLPPAEARAKALSYMLPGVILQPNGIFGVTLAQQHGCVFVNAV